MLRIGIPGLIITGLIITAAVAPAADNVLTRQEKQAGWVLLFDGRTLDGWEVTGSGSGRGRAANPAPAPAPQPGAAAAVGSNPRPCSAQSPQSAPVPGGSHWEIVRGLLSPCGDPAGYLSTTRSYKDFVLKIDFKTAEDTNSGVFVRSPEGIQGYEVQIWKQQPAGYNTGSIVNVGRTTGVFKFKPDEWNQYEITADGDHLVVILNGVTTLDVHDSKFPDGRIRLQYQKYPIEFRNIKMKPLTH